MQGQRVQQSPMVSPEVEPAPLLVFPKQRGVGLLQRAGGFLQGGLEAAVNGHDLAGGLHLRRNLPVTVRELVEGPTGNLHHAIVQGRLEGGAGRAGDRVGDFVEAPAHSDLGGDAGDGIAGGLAGQSRRPADPGVHLDHVVFRLGLLRPRRTGSVPHGVGMGPQRELDIAAPLDAQAANDVQARGAEQLVLFVRQRLAGRDHDAVPGVRSHGIQVLHVAHGDAVVGAVADDLVLDFLPAHQGALQQYLADRACGQTALHNGQEFLLGVGDAAARSPQGICRPHHQGQARLGLVSQRFVHGGNGAIWGHRLANIGKKLPEEVPVLRLAYGLQRGAQQPHVVAIQDAGVGQINGQVEPGLTAQGRQDPVGPLAGYDAFQYRHGERLDVHPVGDVPVGHDGGRIGVDQHDGDAFLAEGLARLGAGVIKLGGLPDNNGAGAYNQNFAGLLVW